MRPALEERLAFLRFEARDDATMELWIDDVLFTAIEHDDRDLAMTATRFLEGGARHLELSLPPDLETDAIAHAIQGAFLQLHPELPRGE